MVENGPAGASEASVDIDLYKAAAILALLRHFRRWIPPHHRCASSTPGYIRDGASHWRDWRWRLRPHAAASGGARWWEALAAQKRSLFLHNRARCRAGLLLHDLAFRR